MTAPSRRLEHAARRLADQHSQRIADAAGPTVFRATVTTVIAGGAADEVASLVRVTYRGNEVTVTDYPDSYTPAVGHRVLCLLTDNLLSILHRAVGQP